VQGLEKEIGEDREGQV